MSNIFIILIMMHFIGDYYLQTKAIARLKKERYFYIIVHSIIYSIPILFSMILFVNNNYITVVILFCTAHFVIDSIKFFIKPFYYPKTKGEEDEEKEKDKHFLKINVMYFIDQLLHILIIAIISFLYLKKNTTDLFIDPRILEFFNLNCGSFIIMIKIIAAFLIVLKPISVSFYEIFNIKLLAKSDLDNNNSNTQKEKEAIGAGSIIGYMERIVMLILLIVGEYTAMGFIIAGKTIVRLHSKVKQEFLIIGTFYGIIASLVIFIVFFIL